VRSGPGARVWRERNPLRLRVTRWASHAASRTTQYSSAPFPAIPRQVSAYPRSKETSRGRSCTLNCGSSPGNSILKETGPYRRCRVLRTLLGRAVGVEMDRYRSRSVSTASMSRVLGRGSSRRDVSGERSPATLFRSREPLWTNLQAQSVPSELVFPSRTPRRCETTIRKVVYSDYVNQDGMGIACGVERCPVPHEARRQVVRDLPLTFCHVQRPLCTSFQKSSSGGADEKPGADAPNAD
jgi:hypothetical protein